MNPCDGWFQALAERKLLMILKLTAAVALTILDLRRGNNGLRT